MLPRLQISRNAPKDLFYKFSFGETWCFSGKNEISWTYGLIIEIRHIDNYITYFTY